MKVGDLIDLLTEFNNDDEIEIEVYETASGKFVDVTGAVTFVDDAINPTLKIDMEAEKFRKFLPPDRNF